MTTRNSFRLFVEQELGKFPHFVIYAILEWTLIGLLFLDGFLALVSCEFAEFFDLRAPCVLCTRIDHILTRQKQDRCSYNDSICEGHKKDLSSLAYCHVHRKLSDIRRMCEGCLLSFATDNKSDPEAYKSLNGALNKDIEGLFDDEMRARLKLQPCKVKDDVVDRLGNYGTTNGNSNGNNGMVCSCCGEPMKVKSSSSGNASNPAFTSVPSRLSQAPTNSPRAAFAQWRAEEARNTLELTHLRCQELKMSRTNSIIDESNAIPASAKEEPKPSAPPLQEPDDLLDDTIRTPSFVKGNKFFGIPLTDSAAASPRWANRMPRKSLLDRVELASDPVDAIITGTAETDTEAILNRLKRQVRLDRKSLIALYMELDEERSASAVAANNAMAMITRLQAEKAAVQMEQLQYQRMMEEQAEYDQEALQMMKELLGKREDEIKELEAEVDLYRERYGVGGSMRGEIERSDPLEKSQSFSSVTERSDHGSPLFSIVATDTEMELHEHVVDKMSNNGSENNNEKDNEDTDGDNDGGDDVSGGLTIDIERERSYLLGQLRMLESRILHNSADTVSDSGQPEVAEGKDEIILKEVSELGEKLRALEEDSRFLKRALLTLQRDRIEGSKLLTEIANNLQKLRHIDNLPPDPAIAVES